MKLKNRLSLAVTVVSAATLLTSFLTVYVLVRRDETRDLDLALVAQAQALAQIADAKNPGRPTVLDGVAEVPESLRPTQRYIAVYDERGALLSATKNFGSEVPSFESLGASTALPTEGVPVDLGVNGKALRGVTVPVGNGGAALLYAASRRTVDEDASFLHRTLGVLFLSATVATALFSRWLGGRLAGDVHAIARVAREVERGNLEARVGDGARGSIETRALAADLDHMIEHLGALVAAQRLFVSHAAHELRSPLSTLRGELQLALRRPRDAAGYQRTIEEALVDVEALSRLSEDLLTLARVQAPRSLGAEVVNVGEIVADALRLARGPAEARRVSLEQAQENTAAAPLFVRGDRSEIIRALRNLVDNAVAHGPAEAPVLTTIMRCDASVEIAVIDRGPGVAKEDEPHIFEPFYRGTRDRGDDRPGAGLGLAIARGIARNLGGDVWLDRSHQGGARFVLSLPAHADADT
ncbi:HAMP domain-containing sensor histidine kinase [Polyangium sp. 15x6]|uniref:sensor histidine kinase n=1 Tax=Polyangium sp. 15x6 TaxID=3042687 RepID=UPI00249C5562|nr:HAMP domain-containing sensor histidine kinase [Polyangium sp. 15x6]MDI3285453.1 HAMP domain-containing sensor histidine kinase [Polyangium sp. 15x6]